MEITQEELEKIINLHNNSVELLSSLNNNKNQVFAYEYYLISKDWIDNFKNFFHFNGIIGMLTQGRDIKIESIPVIRNLPKINPEEKRKIQIIKNGEIMVKSDRNESIPFCFLNFCLIAPKYYKIITERYNIDQRVKANVYVSKNDTHNRFGISVSKKVGNAVTRNKYRRRIKDIIDKYEFKYDGYNIIFISRPKLKECNYIYIKENIFKLLDMIGEKNEKK